MIETALIQITEILFIALVAETIITIALIIYIIKAIKTKTHLCRVLRCVSFNHQIGNHFLWIPYFYIYYRL